MSTKPGKTPPQTPPPAPARTGRSLIAMQRDSIIDKRAVVVGLLIFAMLAGLGLLWKMTASGELARRPADFQFDINEPPKEQLSLSDPKREIMRESTEKVPDEPVQADERPDIHVTVAPTDVEVADEVVQSENVKMEAPTINLKSTEIDIDAPQEISQVSEKVEYAITPIAANTVAPADIFRYKEPAPPDKPALYSVNRAPKPGRGLRVLPQQFGDQNAPSMGVLGEANINLFGTGDYFRAMSRLGDVAARSSVDNALHWLATHQEAGGGWLASKTDGTDSANVNTAITGLATLAFMGGGNTIRKGEYRRNVTKALEELMRTQKDDGRFDGNLYTHAVCTIAICEAYGRARDERIGAAARKAVMYLEKGVNPDGGWRYTANCGESDMSVTGWVIMALKTAKLAEIKFDEKVYSQAMSFVDSVTDHGGSRDTNGAVSYTYKPDQAYDNSHPALTCAGMMVRQFSGMGVKSQLLEKGAKLTKDNPPDWKQKDFYYWYYATYAMHNMGGEWRIVWNHRMRDVLLANQVKTGENAGSWDPKDDKWGKGPGRVYTTALGALCLEVYYRYSEACNSFGVAPDLDDLFLQEGQ